MQIEVVAKTQMILLLKYILKGSKTSSYESYQINLTWFFFVLMNQLVHTEIFPVKTDE